MFGVVGASIGNVIEDFFAGQPITIRNSETADGPFINMSAICRPRLTSRENKYLNVPSVSIYKHLPSPPPISNGNWQVTARVWQIWLFPVLNSPKISVIDPVSIPPARSVSSCFEPVVMEMSSLRRWCISVAVVNPMGTSFEAGNCERRARRPYEA